MVERPQQHHRDAHGAHAPSLDRTALSATVHCLTACAIGEVLGMVLGTALDLTNWTTVWLSVVLVLMEIIDNLIMLFILGAMDAGLGTLLFWGGTR